VLRQDAVALVGELIERIAHRNPPCSQSFNSITLTRHSRESENPKRRDRLPR
jgi:hypothetical protein